MTLILRIVGTWRRFRIIKILRWKWTDWARITMIWISNFHKNCFWFLQNWSGWAWANRMSFRLRFRIKSIPQNCFWFLQNWSRPARANWMLFGLGFRIKSILQNCSRFFQNWSRLTRANRMLFRLRFRIKSVPHHLCSVTPLVVFYLRLILTWLWIKRLKLPFCPTILHFFRIIFNFIKWDIIHFCLHNLSRLLFLVFVNPWSHSQTWRNRGSPGGLRVVTTLKGISDSIGIWRKSSFVFSFWYTIVFVKRLSYVSAVVLLF